MRWIAWTQSENFDLGMYNGNLVDHIDAAVAGQDQIDHHHVWLAGFSLLYCGLPVACHTKEFDFISLIQSLK